MGRKRNESHRPGPCADLSPDKPLMIVFLLEHALPGAFVLLRNFHAEGFQQKRRQLRIPVDIVDFGDIDLSYVADIIRCHKKFRVIAAGTERGRPAAATDAETTSP